MLRNSQAITQQLMIFFKYIIYIIIITIYKMKDERDDRAGSKTARIKNGPDQKTPALQSLDSETNI